jgi:hypothetical protein
MNNPDSTSPAPEFGIGCRRPDASATDRPVRAASAGATSPDTLGSSPLKPALPASGSDPSFSSASSHKSWMRDAAARLALQVEHASEVLGKLPTP